MNLNIIILRSIYTERNIPALSFRLSCRAFAHSYRSFTHISESFLLPVPRMVFFRNFRGKDMGLSGDAGGVSGYFFLCLFRHFFLAVHRYFFHSLSGVTRISFVIRGGQVVCRAFLLCCLAMTYLTVFRDLSHYLQLFFFQGLSGEICAFSVMCVQAVWRKQKASRLNLIAEMLYSSNFRRLYHGLQELRCCFQWQVLP